MSLQSRLLSAILVALWVSFSAGAGVAVLQAARGVRAEQTAALDNARQSVRAALAGMPPGQDADKALRRIVASFDGSRHVQASLFDPAGSVAAASRPEDAPPVPGWLGRLIVPSLKPVLVTAGTGAPAVIRLVSAPGNEAAERWGELRTRLAGFGVSFVLAAVLCSLTIARSLRPLTVLTMGMGRVGRGEPAPHLPEAGPRETAALARAFNAMAASLHMAQAQNAALSQQVATIADEERADIARDLHDDIGPLLFAVTAFAAAIGRQVESGVLDAVPAQLSAIQQAVARLQRSVRDMLGRLQTTPAPEGSWQSGPLREDGMPPADLQQSLEELLAFWRRMRPETQFTLSTVLPYGLPGPVRECLFRATQESISNAIRHGEARLVAVSAGLEAGTVMLSVQDDGASQQAPGGIPSPGHQIWSTTGAGLAGMQARVAALGGHVAITREAGWAVCVTIPLASVDPAAPAAAGAELSP